MAVSDQTSVGWLAIPRVAVGAILVWAGVQKLRTGFDATALSTALASWQASGATFEFYRDLVLQPLQPRLPLVATLVVAGELAAGASLVLGLATRLGAFVALVLAANYLCASRETIDVLLAATSFALLGGAGRAFGLDSSLRARIPGWPLG